MAAPSNPTNSGAITGTAVTGAGTINFNGGTHNFAGQFLPTGTVNFNSGTIDAINQGIEADSVGGGGITVTAGLFKGSKQSGTVEYILPKGACTNKGMSVVTFKAVTAQVIK